MRALASDGRGGAWLAVRDEADYGGSIQSEGLDVAPPRRVHFYHYTNLVPRSVFSDVGHPVREQIMGTAAGGDGSLWVATRSHTVYRYDRIGGWERLGVPGWDPGSLTTLSSEANAVAVGPDGTGVLVGKGGRIADLAPGSAVLDAAAGKVCAAAVPAPCGTGNDLRAAAVAPDGSAIVAGDARSILWRPAGWCVSHDHQARGGCDGELHRPVDANTAAGV